MSHDSFIDKCINGEALSIDSDDSVADWHEGDYDVSLAEFLGMTPVEYNAWLLDDTVLPLIIKAHKDGMDFERLAVNQSEKMAARNSDGLEV